jgi:pimeloyl-ACP methyl ester carboxylesterase
MPHKKAHPVPPLSTSAFEQAWNSKRPASEPPSTISGRWLLKAAGLSLAVAAICCWAALCLLFWQGSWQLLYHPTSAVTRTPASAGLPFDSVGFATTEAGEARLEGWWIPAAADAKFARLTVVYLHGQDGNLSNTVDDLAALHNAGVNVLAFDYRGYGQSQFAHPSEAHWREDANWALKYLTETRHVASGSIVLDGKDLGANLALEMAAAHPEIAGAVLESPLQQPMQAIFSDPRARMVPAHWLVRDRFDADEAATGLHVPSLWFESAVAPGIAGLPEKPEAFKNVTAPKMMVWSITTRDARTDKVHALARWLDDLPIRIGQR